MTLLVAWGAAWRLGGRRAGWIAAGVLASTVEFGEDMRRAIVDPPLVLTVALSHLGFVLPATGASPLAAGLLIAVAVPLAFLAKGVVGIGLAVGPPVLYLIVRAFRRRSVGEAVRRLAPVALLGVPIFAAVVVPWALALLHDGGWEALRECLVGNTVGRFAATSAGQVYGHRQPVWYYLPTAAWALLPWSLALPAILRAGGGRAGADPAALPHPGGEEARRLLLATVGIGIALLSLAASKRELYLVPLMPAYAVVVALWLTPLGRPTGPGEVGLDPLGISAGPGADEGRGDRGRAWDRPTALALLALGALIPPGLWIAAWLASHRNRLGRLPTAALHGELTPFRIALSGLVVLAAVGVLASRLVRHLRDGSSPTAPWLVVPFLAVVVAYQTAGKAAIEPLKDPHALTAAVARIAPGRAPVAAYRPSETALGILGFDLDRPVAPLMSPADLAAYLDAHPGAPVAIPVDALRRLPPDLATRLAVLYDETGSKASPYALVTANRSGAGGGPPRAQTTPP